MALISCKMSEVFGKILNNQLPLIRVMLIVTISTLASCKSEYLFENESSTCFPHFPTALSIKPKVTLDSENFSIPVIVYLGSIDNNNIAFEKIISKENNMLYLKTQTYYTIVAKYAQNGKTYFVVNSIELEVVKSCADCFDPCYYVYNREIDLRLKQ